MKVNKSVIMFMVLIMLVTPLSGCSVVNDVAVKLNFRNEKFDYIKQNKVDKIIIQNVRDSGFRFIVNDPQAINDIYKILSKGKECSEKSSLDPDSLSNGKVGIDISGDVDCLKYVFSNDLEEFKKNLNKLIPNVDLVSNNSEQFDTIIKVKNRGYNSTAFKTLITIDNKLDKSFKSYYITAEYNYKDWDINVSGANEMPQDW